MNSTEDSFGAAAAILVFSATCLIPWMVERNKQVFQPIKLWGELQLALVTPGSIILLHDPQLLHPDVLLSLDHGIAVGLRDALLACALCNVACFVGYYMLLGRARECREMLPRSPRLTRFDSLLVLSVVTGLGVAAFVLKLTLAGGFTFLINNVSSRVELQSGLGPLNYFIESAFLIALVVATKRHAILNTTGSLLTLVFLFLVIAVSSSLFGGRKMTLQFALAILVLWSFYQPLVFRLGTKALVQVVALYSIVFLYFFSVLIYRDTSNVPEFMAKAPEIMDMAIASMGEVFVSLSYLDTYIFITTHFDESNYYQGATFLDLKTAFIPSGWLPDKPAVDDGVYVRQAALGFRLEPGTPARELTGYAAWPPETVGAAFMNGGVWWVCVSGALLGAILAKGYLFATRNSSSVVGLIMMLNLFLNFEISNLRIVTLVSTVLVSIILVTGLRLLVEVLPRANNTNQLKVSR